MHFVLSKTGLFPFLRDQEAIILKNPIEKSPMVIAKNIIIVYLCNAKNKTGTEIKDFCGWLLSSCKCLEYNSFWVPVGVFESFVI